MEEYVGMSHMTKLAIQISEEPDETFTLSRKYTKGRESAGFNWRFNREGRIKNIDGFVLPSNVPSRKYGKGSEGIKFNWRFNREGRIKTLDVILFPSHQTSEIIVVEPASVSQLDWDEAFADYFPFPEQAKCINPGFFHLPEETKYRGFLRFGHSMAKELLQNFYFRQIRDAYSQKKQNAKSLVSISENETAMNMLRNVSAILPSLAAFGEGTCEVHYKQL